MAETRPIDLNPFLENFNTFYAKDYIIPNAKRASKKASSRSRSGKTIVAHGKEESSNSSSEVSLTSQKGQQAIDFAFLPDQTGVLRRWEEISLTETPFLPVLDATFRRRAESYG